MKRLACLLVAVQAMSAFAAIGFVDFDGAELGLTAYSNAAYTYTGTGLGTHAAQVTPGTATTTWVAGDAAWPVTRAVIGPYGAPAGMPFNLSDDSVAGAAGNTAFPTDVLGFAGVNFTDGFFGVTDTVNPANTGPVFATFTFNISGASNLAVSILAAAMGDFEASGAGNDYFNFEYSIDGGAFQPLFTSVVDENINQNYVMDSGAAVTLDDPVLLHGVLLNDNYQVISASIPGSGSSLAIRFNGQTDGNEGFGFDNLTVTPEPASLAIFALGALAALRRR